MKLRKWTPLITLAALSLRAPLRLRGHLHLDRRRWQFLRPRQLGQRPTPCPRRFINRPTLFFNPQCAPGTPYLATINLPPAPVTLNQLYIDTGPLIPIALAIPPSTNPNPGITLSGPPGTILQFAGDAPGITATGPGRFTLSLPAISLHANTTITADPQSIFSLYLTGPISADSPNASLTLAFPGVTTYTSLIALTFAGGASRPSR